MRFVLTIVLVCASCVPASLAMAKERSAHLAKKAAAAPATHQSRVQHDRKDRDLGGIHPLVGSGAY